MKAAVINPPQSPELLLCVASVKAVSAAALECCQGHGPRAALLVCTMVILVPAQHGPMAASGFQPFCSVLGIVGN